MKNITKIEDIYPLTIINRRFAGFAVVQVESDAECVGDLQWNEEWAYGVTEEKMEDGWSHICYGIGETIDEAFQDFMKRKKEQDDQERDRPKRDYEADPLTPEELELAMRMAKAFTPRIGLDFVSVQSLNLPPGVMFYFDPPSGSTNNS